MAHLSLSLARAAAGLGVLVLVCSPLACVSAAPDDLEAEIEAPEIEPQMSQACAEDPSHSCCLGQCGEFMYDCNRECRSGDIPDRGACYSVCQSAYLGCLRQCDIIWLHTPPW